VDEIERALYGFGLRKYEVDLIVARFIEGCSRTEIVEEQGWLNERSVSHYLKVILGKLRKGNFKL